MADLMLLIWAKHYHDFVSRIIYLYTTDRLVPYVIDLFIKPWSDPNLQASDVQRRVALLWFFTPFGGAFPRLSSLFVKDWESVPGFVREFLKLVPVVVRNGAKLETPSLVDAVLRALTAASFEPAVPVLDILCVAAVREPGPSGAGPLMCWPVGLFRQGTASSTCGRR